MFAGCEIILHTRLFRLIERASRLAIEPYYGLRIHANNTKLTTCHQFQKGVCVRSRSSAHSKQVFGCIHPAKSSNSRDKGSSRYILTQSAQGCSALLAVTMNDESTYAVPQGSDTCTDKHSKVRPKCFLGFSLMSRANSLQLESLFRSLANHECTS